MPVTAQELVFSSTDLILGMEQTVTPATFLNATFFPKTKFFTGRFCGVDTRKSRRLLAPITKRGQPGRALTRPPLETRFFEPPEIKPVRVTTVTELDERAFGESSFSRRTPSERMADIFAEDAVELIGSITRRIEKMSSDLLFSGEISYLLDSGDVETLDYGSITPTIPVIKWDVDGSDPLADLQTAVNTVLANSGLLCDVVVMGTNVLSTFLAHEGVQTTLNKLNFTLGNIQPRTPVPGTAQFIGRLYRPALDLYSYAEAYEDEPNPGTLKPMIPDNSALLGCSTSPATTAYGSITQTEQDGGVQTYSDVRFVPRQLSVAKEDKHELRMASRPCLVPYDLTGWAVINPLT